MTDEEKKEEIIPEGEPPHTVEEEPEVNFAILGVGFGVAIGAALGIAIGKPGMMIGIGAALGIGIGNYMAYVRERD